MLSDKSVSDETEKWSKLSFFIVLLFIGGCEPASESVGYSRKVGGGNLSAYEHFLPVKLKITPLTEFLGTSDSQEEEMLRVYVALLDRFGGQKKSPGRFRFELYEYVERSAETKGKRLVIWPDIDLTDVVANNNHWQDFLRAYEFTLPLELDRKQSYILAVTCMCPNGKRLLSDYILKSQ